MNHNQVNFGAHIIKMKNIITHDFLDTIKFIHKSAVLYDENILILKKIKWVKILIYPFVHKLWIIKIFNKEIC